MLEYTEKKYLCMNSQNEKTLVNDDFNATFIDLELALCKEAIASGISFYENRFNLKNKMPLHRAQDIINIKCLLLNEYKNAQNLLDVIFNFLENIHTGFWIFKTGRSRLRSDIENQTVLFMRNEVRELTKTFLFFYKENLQSILLRKKSHPIQMMGEKELFPMDEDQSSSDKEDITCSQEKTHFLNDNDIVDTAQRFYFEKTRKIGIFARNSSNTRKEMLAQCIYDLPISKANSLPDIKSPHYSF